MPTAPHRTRSRSRSRSAVAPALPRHARGSRPVATAVMAAVPGGSRTCLGVAVALGAAATPLATAASAEATTTTTASTASTVTVRSGDTLSAIAARNHTTTAALVSANHLANPNTLRVGQVIVLPSATTATTSSKTTTSTTTTTPAVVVVARTYTVRSGDTLSAIASRNGTTVAALVAANGLASANKLSVGQVLKLSGTATTTSSTKTTAVTVPTSFAGRTYAPAVTASATANKAALVAMTVPTKAQMQAMVVATAKSMGVSPALAQAVAFQESGFDMRSVSAANAIGVMQVVPSSGTWASQLVGRQLNLMDPQDNVTAGVAILRSLVAAAPNQPTAIAGYYQGLAGVLKNGMYADTVRYVANVQALMARFS